VVRHVLKEVDGPLARAKEGLPDHRLAVALHGAKNVGLAGVDRVGDGQVVAIQRLVEDYGVGALAERVHQGGRDVARPGPHAELRTVVH
jgi:hypothetical protein